MSKENKRQEEISLLARLSEEELRSKIISRQRTLKTAEKALGRYIDGLHKKERLLMKVYLADRILDVIIHTQLDHDLYVSEHQARG